MSVSTVVKLGGSLLEDSAARARALRAIAARQCAGEMILLVHGGGKRIDADLAARGIPRRTCGGLRVTDAATLESVVAVLCGLVNKSLVVELAALGARSTGISGADGPTLTAEPHPSVDGVELGRVGRIVRANADLPLALIRAGFLPVVAPVAAGLDATLWNVNADSAASALASAVGAKRLVFFTDVEGLFGPDGRLVESLGAGEAVRFGEERIVTGGMRPKLSASVDAVTSGVATVVIAGPGCHETVLADGKGGTRLVA